LGHAPELGKPRFEDVTPLAADTRLFDTPGGTEIAIVRPNTGACAAPSVEAYVTAESGTFRRLRLPARFGAIEAWADAPSLLTADAGISFCGRSKTGPAYYNDSARVCPRDVPLYVDDGDRVVRIGAVLAMSDIEVVAKHRGRGELAARVTGALTPFIELTDLTGCPERGQLAR
jgi:hypothetical protein